MFPWKLCSQQKGHTITRTVYIIVMRTFLAVGDLFLSSQNHLGLHTLKRVDDVCVLSAMHAHSPNLKSFTKHLFQIFPHFIEISTYWKLGIMYLPCIYSWCPRSAHLLAVTYQFLFLQCVPLKGSFYHCKLLQISSLGWTAKPHSGFLKSYTVAFYGEVLLLLSFMPMMKIHTHHSIRI